ncbi:hypothetical protein ACOKFD_18970 [Flagellimonas sp. S174]|uniref:hypothetical protein n=1 Tax=Flagellimonas sp. S174 TaxID=3410790 RepID=UPI00262AF861|nr:hypothetical protein [uncultured Allomuricauda sp.]
MDLSKYISWLCLAVIWGCFVMWEIQIQSWLQINPSLVVRYDLMLLPLLVVVSFYVIYVTLKK